MKCSFYKGNQEVRKEINLVTYFLLTLLCSSIVLPVYAAPIENKQTASILNNYNIVGIREGEIFQRDMPQNTSRITVLLNTSISPLNYKYYSISLLDDWGSRQSVLAEGSYIGQQLLSFSLSPQSKFRKVRLSFYDNKSVERLRWNSPNFNIGEVFLIAGQSNVANHGDTEGNMEDFKANDLARVLDPSNPHVWQPLNGRLPYATSWDKPRNGSPWASFANDLGEKLAARPRYGDVTTIPIALVNVAYGGSSLEVWDPKATADQNGVPMVLFNRITLAASLLKRLTPTNGAYSCGFRAVLWHQGESNSNRDFNKDKKSNAQEPSRKWYADKLKHIAQSFRNNTNCEQPWMVAKTSWLAPHWRTDAKFNPETKFNAEVEIREGQGYLPNRIRFNNSEPIFISGPDTDMLSGDNPLIGARKAYRSDGIHMNRLGLKLHGRLWSEYAANMIEPNNQPLQAEKNLIPEANKIYNIYLNIFARTPEEIAFDKEGMRYWTQIITLYPQLIDDIYQNFLNSDEKYVRNIFQNVVGRRPTWWEVNYWVAELSAKRTTRANLANSDRVGFENTLSVNGKKIFRLYVNVLGRRLPDIQADISGLYYWTNILNSNPSMESSLVAAFYASPEYRVRKAFIRAKGRQPNQSELILYVPQAATNISDAVLSDAIWNNTVN